MRHLCSNTDEFHRINVLCDISCVPPHINSAENTFTSSDTVEPTDTTPQYEGDQEVSVCTIHPNVNTSNC